MGEAMCPACGFPRGTERNCRACEAYRRISLGQGPDPATAVTAGSRSRRGRRRIRPLAGGATSREGVRAALDADTRANGHRSDELARRVARVFAPTLAEARDELRRLRYGR